MTPEERKDRLLPILRELSLLLGREQTRVRTKPLFGGPWGNGAFSLASMSSVEDQLDVVTYYVMDSGSKFILSAASSKQVALADAREFLTIYGACLPMETARHVAAARADREAIERHWDALVDQRRADQPAKLKSIPRRRRQIFEADNGCCHYCGTALTLDGKWHIEHKMPRALGGDSQPGNLVASCVACNMKKRDTTDVEFKARLAQEKFA